MFTPRSHNCAKLSPSPYKHQYGFCKYGSNRHCFRAFATKLWFTNNNKKTERCPGLRRVKESAHTVTNIYKFTTVCKIFRIVNKWKNGLYWWNKLNPCDPVCYFFFNFPVYGQVVSSRENCWTIRFHRFVYHINKRIKLYVLYAFSFTKLQNVNRWDKAKFPRRSSPTKRFVFTEITFKIGTKLFILYLYFYFIKFNFVSFSVSC